MGKKNTPQSQAGNFEPAPQSWYGLEFHSSPFLDNLPTGWEACRVLSSALANSINFILKSRTRGRGKKIKSRTNIYIYIKLHLQKSTSQSVASHDSRNQDGIHVTL